MQRLSPPRLSAVRRATAPKQGRRYAAVVAGVVVAAVVVAGPAAAHTGLPAGGVLDGAAHPFSGLDHLLAMVAVGVVAAVCGDRRVAWLTPAGFVAGMTAGGVAGMAGVHVPFVELAVAASVVSLGALIVAAPRLSGWWLVPVALAVGAAHGHAHGAELPAGALPIAYLGGFITATIVLHIAGMGVGLGLRRVPALRTGAGVMVSSLGVLALLAL